MPSRSVDSGHRDGRFRARMEAGRSGAPRRLPRSIHAHSDTSLTLRRRRFPHRPRHSDIPLTPPHIPAHTPTHKHTETNPVGRNCGAPLRASRRGSHRKGQVRIPAAPWPGPASPSSRGPSRRETTTLSVPANGRQLLRVRFAPSASGRALWWGCAAASHAVVRARRFGEAWCAKR